MVLMGDSRLERLPSDAHEHICCCLVYGDPCKQSGFPRKHTSDKYIGLRTVAALARTSRTLHEPAANILWQWIPDVALLIFTLPRDCYRMEKLEGGRLATTFEITRQLGSVDLARFRLYAERVIKVGVWDYADDINFLPNKVRGYATTPNSLEELGRVAAAGGWRLLPNVTTLLCEDHDWFPISISPQVPHLFGPHLRDFKFQRRNLYRETAPPEIPCARIEGEERFMTMLAALQPYAAHLVNLSICIEDLSRPIVEAFWNVVLLCRDIVCLDSGSLPITPAALRHLARLPFLEKLSFASTDKAFTKQTILAFHHDLPPSETFPRLRASTMTLVNLDLAWTFVRHISSPYLQGLEIEVSPGGKPVSNVSAARFFRAFCHLPNISALMWLLVRFDVYCREKPRSRPDPITQELLRPFLGSPRIDFFELFVGCPFDLNDAFIKDMVVAWPNLQNLRLGTYHLWYTLDYTPEVTWNGIIAMAHGWRHLQELSIEFDTDISRVQPWAMELLQEMSRNGTKNLRTLEFMDVGFSKIDDEMAVASLLSQLFTPIAEVNSSWDTHAQQEEAAEEYRMEEEGDAFQPDPELETRVFQYTDYYERWLGLEDPMRHLQLIRRQERNWVSAISVLSTSEQSIGESISEGSTSEESMSEDEESTSNEE
ncbi:hypothetical protein L226DRAFT_532501 [Lentinus tigrinus ALCF2SS1-7]|uniref:F-box domain-containing protein n=1 Tax=Lentinus tigrinus ALCF2SS1-6 TaxID=1328759 RepID=A0A5C2SFU2_9APHY|nr:hypothetical protein L227DRAFT_652001 [Lentinus tigrinus ALCF2SS1-6]RPD77723.1 hypothetical protein L226DRAFT_532501 [Lentinus tigrinus ALCF2SS1-7]